MAHTHTWTDHSSISGIHARLRADRAELRARPLYRATQVIWYALGVVEAMLALRFLLRLLAANPEAGFTRLVEAVTNAVAAPFYYVFGATNVGASTFEWSTLLAGIVYWLVAWLIVRAIVMSRPVTEQEAEDRLPYQG